MRKLFIITLLLGLCVSLYAQTNVSGGIYSNTTWTKANSPYLVSSELVIFSEETLTIEPGVTVLFAPNVELDIRGRLIAVGTQTDSITFTSSQTGTNSLWAGTVCEYGSSVNINYCNFSNALTALSSSSSISNCSISNCVFKKNNTATSYLFSINNCVFIGNTTAINHAQAVKNSSFISNYTAINNYIGDGSADTILNNYIKGNHTSISLSVNDYQIITGNTIIENDTGIFIPYNSFQGNITNNTICHNNYNIVLNLSSDYNVRNNCWCSSDSAAIRATIYDGYTNVQEGLVHFVPFNTCVDPDPVTAITTASTQSASFVTIAPNPNSGNFNVQLQNNASASYSVYDSKGTAVSSGSISNSETISLPNALPGIYYLVIFSNQQEHTEKIVVE